MNTLEQRIENKTRTVIKSIEDLAKLSVHGDKIKTEYIDRIETTLIQEMDVAIDALRTGRDCIQFKL